MVFIDPTDRGRSSPPSAAEPFPSERVPPRWDPKTLCGRSVRATRLDAVLNELVSFSRLNRMPTGSVG